MLLALERGIRMPSYAGTLTISLRSVVLSDDDFSYYCSKRTGIFIQLLVRSESMQTHSSISHHNLNIVCTTSNEILARIKSNYSMPSKLAYELWFYIARIYWSEGIVGRCCICSNRSFVDMHDASIVDKYEQRHSFCYILLLVTKGIQLPERVLISEVDDF